METKEKKTQLQKFLEKKHYMLYDKADDCIIGNSEGYPWSNLKNCLHQAGSSRNLYILSWNVEELQEDSVLFKNWIDELEKEKQCKTLQSKIEYAKKQIAVGTLIIVNDNYNGRKEVLCVEEVQADGFMYSNVLQNAGTQNMMTFESLAQLKSEKRKNVTFKQR